MGRRGRGSGGRGGALLFKEISHKIRLHPVRLTPETTVADRERCVVCTCTCMHARTCIHVHTDLL